MSPWSGMDRRKFPRVIYPCMVVLRDAHNQMENILTHTDNIAIGGVCLTFKKHLKIFSPLEVELDLLDCNEHIKCQGRVVWSIRSKGEENMRAMFYDTGIEFINLAEKDQQRLENIIQKLAKHKENLV